MADDSTFLSGDFAGSGADPTSVLSGGTPAPAPAPAGPIVGMDGSPTMESAANIPPPNPAVGVKPPSKWEMILTGALRGLAGSAGAKNFAQGVAGGAKASLEGAQQDKDNAVREEQVQSQIRFQTAQAAHLATETTAREFQNKHMDQDYQRGLFKDNLDSAQKLQTAFGIQPVVSTANDGKSEMAAMTDMTQKSGGVPPILSLQVGPNQFLHFDMGQIARGPAGLATVNDISQRMGRPPISPQDWARLPEPQRIQMIQNSANFFNPVLTDNPELSLANLKNTLLTAKSLPDSTPNKQDTVSRLQASLDRGTQVVNGLNARNNQQAAAKSAATENARVAADNSPTAIAGAAAKAGAEQKAKNAADLAAMQGNVDALGNRIGVTPEGQQLSLKEYNSRSDKFSKAFVQPLTVLQKTNMEFDRINNNPNQTGAEKVTALLNAVGISGDPLKGKGFRISNDIINEHAGARNIWEAGVQKLNNIVGTGGPITSQQIKDYTAVAEGVVHDAYVTAAQEAVRQGLPVNFLPKATSQGQKANDVILRIYADSAGGNVEAAHQALTKAGWK